MPFDPTTAKLDAGGGFDPSSAQPTNAGAGDPDPSLTPGGLHHFRLPTGEDVYSKNAPPANAAPVVSRTAADVSDDENESAGMGKAFMDLGRGVHQLYAKIADKVAPLPQTMTGMIEDQRPTREAAVQADIDESRKTDAPLMATTAGRVGNIEGNVVPMMAMPQAGIIGSATEGALTGSVQPVATGESRAQNIGMGTLGGGVGGTIGKAAGLLRGFGTQPGRQAAVDLLRAEGVPVSVAQQTGAKAAQHIERASAMINDSATEFSGETTRGFNQAALRRIGVTDPNITAATPKVMNDADNRIGSVMDGVVSRTTPQFDTALVGDIQQIQRDLPRQMPKRDASPITQNINDILTNAVNNGGSLDGTFIQKLQSNLKTLAKTPKYQPASHDLLEAIHNVVNRYASPQDQSAMLEAQRQFRAMKQIEGATNKTTGDISPTGLLNSMGQKAYGGRNQVLYGRGDQSLVDLARAGSEIIPDKLGNSGTAERLLPVASAIEALRSAEPWKAALKLGMGAYGGGLLGGAMRSQGVIGKTLANGVPGLRAVAKGVKRFAPAVGYGTAQAHPRDTDQPAYVGEEIGRASGGRVDHEALVNRLFTRWKQAKTETDKTTKPLLKLPDAAVIRALDIAQEHI